MDKITALEFSGFAYSSQRSAIKQIVLDLTPDEAENLEKYCDRTGQSVTTVIEELIRGLSVS